MSLRRFLKTARGAYPPVALAEIYQEYKSPLTKIRRLHLMVVESVTPLAQAAVSVQNPPSGSQTCFPGGWVR